MRLIALSSKLLFSICLLLLLTSVAGAQSKTITSSLVLKNYSVEDGLPSSEVYYSLQDSHGFIWFSTDRGVARFDGYEFEVFTTENGLPDNVIFEMFEDYSGKIWFISYSLKLSYFEHGKIHLYKYNSEILKQVGGAIKSSFYVDHQNTIHLGTRHKGYLVIDSAGHAEHKTIKDTFNGYLKFQVTTIEGKLFWYSQYFAKYAGQYTLNQTVECLVETPLIKKKIMLSGSKYSKSSDVHMNLSEAGDELTLVFSGNLFKIRQDNTNKPKPIVLKNNILTTFVDQNKIWMGSYQNGGFCFEKGRDSIRPLFTFLEGSSVSFIMRDIEQGYWISSLEKGVFYTPGLFNKGYTKKNGLCNNYITNICGNGKDEILIGGRNAHLNRITNETQIETIELEDTLVQVVRSIRYDTIDDKYIIVSYGMNYLKGDTLISDHDHRGNRDYVILNSDSTLICSDFLYVYQRDSVSAIHQIAPTLNCQCVEKIDQNTVLVGGLDGLYQYNNDRVTYLGKQDTLFSYRISDIKRVSGFQYLLGTRGAGLVLVREDTIINITKRDGLASNQIYRVYVGPNDYMWVCTNNGLSVINSKNLLDIRTLTTKHGLLSNEVTDVYVHENTAWIGTKEGLNRMDTRILELVNNPYPVIIKSIESGDGAIQPEPGNIIHLPYDKSFMQLAFAALNYRSQGNILYRYRVKGLYDNWVDTKSNTIQLASIPPGAHTFQIMASNEDGIWSSAPTELFIVVSSPFWKTWWFFMICSFALVGLVSLAFWIRLKRVRDINRFQKQIAGFQQQALTAQMDPHFIFNSLNSIQSFITKNDRKQSNRYLAKFAKLMRITLANSQQIEIPISQEILALNLYLELESVRFKHQLEYLIRIDPTIDQERALIPTLLIQPFAENSIWHGLMHKEQGGKLSISLIRKDNTIVCIIEDNGVGRKVSAIINEQKNKNSYSTDITAKRLNLLSSEYGNEYRLEIMDIKGANNDISGTKVQFTIPYKLAKKTSP